MTESLDDIMSGRGKPASADTTAPEPTPVSTDDNQAHSRDDKGRFAGKQEPVAEPPVAAAPEPAPVAPTPPVQQPNGFVPIQALDGERGKRKELEDRYEKDMRELRNELAKLSRPQTPAEPAKPPPALWDDPDGYLQHQLSPVQQQMQEMRETLWETQATGVHGFDKVNAAKQAADALAGTPQGLALHREITAGGNPFDNLVKWHKRQAALSEVGDDPEAYFQRRLAAMQAEQSQSQPEPQQTQQPAPAPVLPTAFAKTPAGGPRGGPEYGGPRPLSEIMGGR